MYWTLLAVRYAQREVCFVTLHRGSPKLTDEGQYLLLPAAEMHTFGDIA